MNTNSDLWYVKTQDGDVHRVTLDQLDEAFNAGRIDESVQVLPAGETRWSRLGELLGLDAQEAPAVSAAPASYAMPVSLRPMSLDLGDDLDEAALRPKPRRGVVIAAMVGALALGAIVLAGTRGSTPAPAVAAAAVAPPPPAAAALPPPAVAAPAPPPAAPAPDARFSDEQRAKLAAADKVREDRSKSRKKGRGAGGAPSPKTKSQGFTSGGNKYDPLNAN